MIPSTRSTTAALLECVELAGIACGDGRAPADGGWQGAPGQSDFVPYAVLHRLGVERQTIDASVADSFDAPKGAYQVTCVGADQAQAEMVATACARALLGGELLIDDRDLVVVRHDGSAAVGVDEDTHPPLFFAAERFTVETDALMNS